MNYLKIILKNLFIFLFWMMILYGSIAYINLETNPLIWMKDDRESFVMTGLLGGVLILFLNYCIEQMIGFQKPKQIIL